MTDLTPEKYIELLRAKINSNYTKLQNNSQPVSKPVSKPVSRPVSRPVSNHVKPKPVNSIKNIKKSENKSPVSKYVKNALIVGIAVKAASELYKKIQ